MKQIQTEEQFLKYIKVRVNYKDYDWNVLMKEKPRLAFEGRRWYENPFFWKEVFDNGFSHTLDFLLFHYKDKIDQQILEALIASFIKDIDLFTIIKLVDEIKRDQIDYDKLMFSAIFSEKETVLKFLMNFVKDNKIEPPYENWGNVGNGRGLSEAAKIGNMSIINLLLENGAIITNDDGFAYLNALKHCRYDIAKKLVNQGIDIHMKNDLGLSLLKRETNVYPIGSMKEDKEYLISLYDKK